MPHGDLPRVLGIVLAAGAGTRYGGPKALVGAWLTDRVRALWCGGCIDVLVILGACAGKARALLSVDTRVVVARDWAEGMGASLRAGLMAARKEPVDAVLVALVDTPGLTAEAVRRVIDAGTDATGATAVLAQASYGGQRGHPALIGRAHWAGVVQVAVGDRGARDYLRGRAVVTVECGDVADGRDVDVPAVPGSSATGTLADSPSVDAAAVPHPDVVY